MWTSSPLNGYQIKFLCEIMREKLKERLIN